MTIWVDAKFWSDESKWPYEQPGYVFLLRAVDEVGRVMHQDDWTGQECLTPLAPLLPELSRAQLWERLRANSLLMSHRPDLGRKPIQHNNRAQGLPAGLAYTGDSSIVDFTPAEWEAACEISQKQHAEAQAIRGRLNKVGAQITAWLRSGQLVSALRPELGGLIGQPLTVEKWITERLGQRFYRGIMNPRDPFGTGVGGGADEWIFVTRESLDRLVKPAAVGAHSDLKPAASLSVDVQTGPGRPRGTGLPFNEEIAEEATALWKSSNGKSTQAEAIRAAVKKLRDNGKPIPVDGSYTDRYAIDRIRRMMPPADKRK